MMSEAPKDPPTPEPGGALRVPGVSPKPGLPEPSHGTDTPLPHERDQTVGQVATEPDPIIEQARRDIAAGLVDTDMRATPGLDAERRAGLVPGTPAAAPRAPASPTRPRKRR